MTILEAQEVYDLFQKRDALIKKQMSLENFQRTIKAMYMEASKEKRMEYMAMVLARHPEYVDVVWEHFVFMLDNAVITVRNDQQQIEKEIAKL